MADSETHEEEPFQASSDSAREVSDADKELLAKQDSRTVTEFRAKKFQGEARKHWDLFYKRNETRFFKDRHWTRREFAELSGLDGDADGERGKDFLLLEVGCGVGNFFFPLLEECPSLQVVACDFSQRAVDLVRRNPLYASTGRVRAFRADVSAPDELHLGMVGSEKVDAVSLVFVLSAIAPGRFPCVFENLTGVLREGGKLLFRDYAVNDMAMVRFGPGTKIAERHYLRQDGTTSYFFRKEELAEYGMRAGLEVQKCEYVARRTVNKKEGVDVERTFLQAVMVLRKSSI